MSHISMRVYCFVVGGGDALWGHALKELMYQMLETAISPHSVFVCALSAPHSR